MIYTLADAMLQYNSIAFQNLHMLMDFKPFDTPVPHLHSVVAWSCRGMSQAMTGLSAFRAATLPTPEAPALQQTYCISP
jgi:hypothetical protein